MRAKLIQKTWMGMNIVAWCDENGRVCVAEAYCPHLGSDLGARPRNTVGECLGV